MSTKVRATREFLARRALERGFTMVTVVLLIAVVTVSGLLVVDLIGEDLGLLGAERRTLEAREVAEGGLMELLNDQQVMNSLPGLDSATLRVDVQPGPGSAFVEQARGKTYTGRVELVRVAPMLESSEGLVRAVVYQVSVEGEAGSGGASARVEAEVFRVASVRPGLVQPRVHAR
jgi:hypothetical protein